MTEISLDLIKELRAKTGVSVMQCKKALEEAEGDMERALINLTKKSGEIAAKKSDRELGAGVVVASEGVMIELSCETDFVSGNDEFKAYAHKLAELIAQDADDDARKAIIDEATQKFGERIEITRQEKYASDASVYIHANNSVGAFVEFDGDAGDLGRNIAMHIAAQNPKYFTRDDISEEELDKAQEVLQEEVADKPADMQAKILEGKINAYFKERVLLEQSYIMDPSQSVADILPEEVSISRYVRFGVGEE